MTRYLLVSLAIAIPFVVGCAQDVCIRVTDADSGELLRGGFGVSRSTETWNVFSMEHAVESTEVGFVQENPSRRFTVHPNDTIYVETMGYKRCRFQIDGRRVYMQSPSPTPPWSSIGDMFLRGDYFDRGTARVVDLPDSGVLDVPLYRDAQHR